MNDHKGKKYSGITLPFSIERVCQAVFVCVFVVLYHQVVLGDSLGDLGLPFDSLSVLCSFGVVETSYFPLVSV